MSWTTQHRNRILNEYLRTGATACPICQVDVVVREIKGINGDGQIKAVCPACDGQLTYTYPPPKPAQTA